MRKKSCHCHRIAVLTLQRPGRCEAAMTGALFVKRAGRGPRMVLLHGGVLPGELC